MESFNPNIRSEIVEVTVSNIGATEFNLGSLPNLRGAKKIIRVEAFNVNQVTLTPSGKTVINNTVFQKSFLKLINSRNTDLRQVPLTSISKTANGTTIPAMDCGSIDPEKSKIVVATPAGLALNEAFLFMVTYEKGDKN